MTVTLLTSHRHTDPYGLEGGEPGAKGRNYVIRESGQILELKGNDEIEVNTNDIVVLETPGGGGFGKKV